MGVVNSDHAHCRTHDTRHLTYDIRHAISPSSFIICPTQLLSQCIGQTIMFRWLYMIIIVEFCLVIICRLSIKSDESSALFCRRIQFSSSLQCDAFHSLIERETSYYVNFPYTVAKDIFDHGNKCRSEPNLIQRLKTGSHNKIFRQNSRSAKIQVGDGRHFAIS